MNVITAKKTADTVVKTLSNYRNEESFTQIWSHADVKTQKIKIGIEVRNLLSEMPRCLEPDHHADFRALLVRHLLQRTTAHNRRQKTTYVSQFITQVLTKSSVNFNQVLRAMTRRFCAHWAKSYSVILQASTTSKLYQVSMAWIVKCPRVRSQSLKTTTAGTHAGEKTQP